jgi:hypothetical protein
MVTKLQKLTVIFLVLVQFFAPLVHAHAGENIGTGSLHVPGLERYSTDREPPVESLQCSVALHDFSSDGILVGINLGIKERQSCTGIDPDSFQFLHQQALVLSPPLFTMATPFSPPSQRFISRLLPSSFLSRAPPAL